jgi:hypothetical protein
MTLKKLLEQLNSIPKKHLNTDVRVSVDALIDEDCITLIEKAFNLNNMSLSGRIKKF